MQEQSEKHGYGCDLATRKNTSNSTLAHPQAIRELGIGEIAAAATTELSIRPKFLYLVMSLRCVQTLQGLISYGNPMAAGLSPPEVPGSIELMAEH